MSVLSSSSKRYVVRDWLVLGAYLALLLVPPGVPYELVDQKDWPTDRTVVDAWECTAGQVSVNMPKARVIHMDRIRKARNAELAKLDVPFMIPFETGDQVLQRTIAAQKQDLHVNVS